MSAADSAPRRRGRPPRLSRELVVAAALAVVESEGTDALTIRRVALELGSSAMALYRHVHDKDELLVLLLDRLAAELPRPALPSEPHARLKHACRVMRDGLAQHPWVVDVLAAGDLIAPSILWLVEEIVSGFVACGLSHAQATDAYRAVWQFTVGELIVHRGLERLATLGRRPYVLTLLTSLDAREFPTLAAMAGYWSGARGRDAFDLGLEALLHGLLDDRRTITVH